MPEQLIFVVHREHREQVFAHATHEGCVERVTALMSSQADIHAAHFGNAHHVRPATDGGFVVIRTLAEVIFQSELIDECVQRVRAEMRGGNECSIRAKAT